jgi:hypothetical protein
MNFFRFSSIVTIFYRFVRISMDVHEFLRISTNFYGFQQVSKDYQDLSGFLRISAHVYEIPRASTDFYRFLCTSTDFHWCLRTSTDFHRFSWMSMITFWSQWYEVRLQSSYLNSLPSTYLISLRNPLFLNSLHSTYLTSCLTNQLTLNCPHSGPLIQARLPSLNLPNLLPNKPINPELPALWASHPSQLQSTAATRRCVVLTFMVALIL